MDFGKFEQRVLEELDRNDGRTEVEVSEWDYYPALGASYSAVRKYNHGREDIGYVVPTRIGDNKFRLKIYSKAEEQD